jgi:hypothetical protein
MTSVLKKIVSDRSPLSPDAMLLDVYSWSEEGLGGKTMYRHRWLRRWSSMGQELSIGEDVVGRVSQASWWAWDNGSRPIHLRWPKEYQGRIRDG